MKIGIITHYYKSRNYGGNLQAYALCEVLRKLGNESEQISLSRTNNKNIKGKISDLLNSVLRLKHISCIWNLRKRNKAIQHFNIHQIPHSKVYHEKNIVHSANDYDVFITGSDQVWHPKACCDAYLLQFVPSTKIKISYAASVATDQLTTEIKDWYQEAFQSFDAISVREESSAKLLSDISPCEIEVLLDPTLLLDKNDWNKILEESEIKEKYIFCYFLGADQKGREVALAYAREHGLKVVSLPHLLGAYRSCDKNYGDYQLYDVSPGKLLSLIKNAEHIFTDSFHAAVFSLIFEKQFNVFQRKGAETMSVRISSLLDLYDLTDMFCDDISKVDLAYIESLASIQYQTEFEKFESAKEQSIQYLKQWTCK
ncbi:MAG: polysaccharide pyruvyl transferase family protein [Clostridia bacterium]|nr:polysaccharide pyruvyl transferase family protein [Clostridia bacterium]